MARVGLNALVLRTDASYRNAGPSRYAAALVRHVVERPSEHVFTVYVNEMVRELRFAAAGGGGEGDEGGMGAKTLTLPSPRGRGEERGTRGRGEEQDGFQSQAAPHVLPSPRGRGEERGGFQSQAAPQALPSSVGSGDKSGRGDTRGRGDARGGGRVRVWRTRAPTSRTGVRILWEHLAAPWVMGAGRLDLVHSMLNVVPLAAPTRHVVTVHDVSFMRLPGAHPAHRRWYLTAATRLSVRRAAAVLADSRATKDDLVQLLGADPARVTVVYPGTEPEFHPRPPAEVRAFRAAQGVAGRFVLFVGTLEPRKNVDTLVRAFGALASGGGFEGELVIAGGRGWGTERIDAALAASGVRDRIRQIGYVKSEDLPGWYAAASLVVYPSGYEGFGIPVLEAMASGTPVITSNLSSLPEVGGDAALLVDPRDVSQLAAAMQAVLSSPARQAEMRARGLAQAQRFDWTAAADRCLDVYRRVLRGG